MRILCVDDMDFFLRDDDAARLERDGLIYVCGDPAHDHDFHINPEFEFDGEGDPLADLLRAIFEGRMADAPSMQDIGVQNVTMSGLISRETVQNTNEAGLEKKIAFIQRNLGLNLATQAMNNGAFEKTVTAKDDGVHVQVFASIIPPGKRASFAWHAKRWVIGLIQGMPGVSDQRKDEVIALIRQA